MKEQRLSFDAWWLPGMQLGEATETLELEKNGILVRAPRLEPFQMAALGANLRQARGAYLAQLSVNDIVERIGAAINRWLDPFSPYLYNAVRLIHAFTGYPEAAVQKGLATLLATYRPENLRRLLCEELGDPEVLDCFRPRRGAPGCTHATGPELVVHTFAGNTPGLPAQSLIMATLVKAASFGKVASEEPIFAPLFLRSLAEVDSRLGACLATTYWPGDATGLTEAAFASADVVVAYGSVSTIAAIRQRVPGGRRLITYGHKLSFGVVGRELLSGKDLDSWADRAAYDVIRFDQQGCVSPHLFYVEEGGAVSPRQFAQSLAVALERWSTIVPRGRLSVTEWARWAEVRRGHEFRAANTGGAVFGGERDQWCVLFDSEPSFTASCLNRAIWVKPLPDLVRLPELLIEVRPFLQTIGMAFAPERLVEAAELLATTGADRLCPLGQMGDPPVTWHHDGRSNLLDFLRFTDLEPESTAGLWEFTHPDQGVLGYTRPLQLRDCDGD